MQPTSTVCPIHRSSSDWPALPAELLLSVSHFLPGVRFLLVLSSVHRRLYELVQGAGGSGVLNAGGPAPASSSASSGSYVHGLFWRDLPLYHVSVDAKYRLASLRNLPACWIAMAQCGHPHVDAPWLHMCVQALGSFTQLTSLTLTLHFSAPEVDWPPVRLAALNTLATSLSSLRHLICLELH